ncbi:MAG: hypothetical protein ABWW66_06910 [Archaeoglobaceae archaeon]
MREKRYAEVGKPSRALQFLYSYDELLRFRAAEALGFLCRGNVARDFILRLFWHLSDESGAYCVGAPLGIAEIGRSNPEVFASFANKYVSLLDNWEVERKYVAYGISRVADIVDRKYAVEKLKEKIEEIRDAEFIAYAAMALAKLGERVDLSGFPNELVAVYDGEKILKVRLHDLAVLRTSSDRTNTP